MLVYLHTLGDLLVVHDLPLVWTLVEEMGNKGIKKRQYIVHTYSDSRLYTLHLDTS